MSVTSSTVLTGDVVLLDDGNFSVSLRDDHGDASDEMRGFLQHRCYEGVTTPDGYECIGTFEPEGGRWVVRIDSGYDPRTGSVCRRLGRFASPIDAIAALWAARHRAHRRHLSD